MRDSHGLTIDTQAARQLNPRVRLCWRRIEAEWVVFEELSGQTHKLDDTSAAVLMCHESQDPLRWPDLVHRLETEFEQEVSAELAPLLLAATRQLVAVGLLITVPLPAAAQP